ncbi:MAG: glycosyltransferase family 2 protein [Sedimentisphaerales bacterium]|nr:glycosyltransferase family 2 protein [Sedimentisphaerales bacterium]
MLKNCLYSIRQHTDSKRIKVIVVDNSSHDGSREMVESLFPEVVLINSGGNLGFAKANNIGIAHADTPFVSFLNPDTIVMENSIHTMINFMETNPSVGGLGCKMMFDDGNTQPLGLQWFPSPLTELFSILFLSDRTPQKINEYLPYHDPERSGYVLKLYGGFLMVRKEVLDTVGYFDERFFMYGEDVDLSRRITDGGWKLYYLAGVKIIHLCGGASSSSSSNFATLMKCESISKLMEKYYGKAGRFFYKFVIFTGSQLRLFLLGILYTVSHFRHDANKRRYRDSLSKHLAMFKWSLNLQEPTIKN